MRAAHRRVMSKIETNSHFVLPPCAGTWGEMSE